MIINNVKGTHDVFGSEASAYSYVENIMKGIANLYAFKEVRPPVLEHSEVFVRGVGEGSDIVRKEMYTFLDKGGRSLTIRPEFTAGVMRLIIQNKLYATNELPLKVSYLGPLFRYERPQLGRYRQFNQFGVESVGVNSPYADLETIILAYSILATLGLDNVTIKINTLGDDETRNNYRKALVEHFSKHIDNMCPDCKSRLELNPLRILDCKVPEDRQYIDNAPKVSDYLSEASKERFNTILDALDELGIPYEVDEGLVRGLDYYSETVYEFHYQSAKGNDYGAIGGGGHYDKLVAELGGPSLHGVGFSFGIERIVSVLLDDEIITLDEVDEGIEAYVMPMGKNVMNYALGVASTLRSNNYGVDICLEEVKLVAMFKRAEKKNVLFAVIIGDNELATETVVLKNLETQEQITVKYDELVDKFDEIFQVEEHCHCEDEECECRHEHCDCEKHNK